MDTTRYSQVNDLKKTQHGIVKQAILSLCVSMSYFCIGLVRGYTSPAVPSMKQIDPDLLPTKYIASWASSVAPCGAIMGSIVAGPLLHYLGRKYTIIAAAPLWSISWLIIANASSWQYIVSGRILCGFCAGLSLPSAQIYVTECTHPKNRGVMGSFPSILMSAGILTTYILGTFITWNYLAWTCSGIAILLTVIMTAMPRSPVWLRSKNLNIEASKSDQWLGLEPHINITQMQNLNKRGRTKERQESSPHSWNILMSRPILLPLSIGVTLLAIQQLSGIDSIIFFTVEIFRSSGSSIDSNVATIIVGVVQLVSNIASLLFVDKSGRKPLLIASGAIMSISNALMGTAFYLNAQGYNRFGYLPLVSLIVFMTGFSVGFGCIPFLFMGETFPSPQRSLLSSIAGSVNLGVMFVVLKTYHPLEEAITTAGTFWVYSIICTIGVFFVIGYVPETKGKHLDNIATLFIQKNSKECVNMSEEDQHILK